MGHAKQERRQEMANPFVKFWKYLMASFSSKVDEPRSSEISASWR